MNDNKMDKLIKAADTREPVQSLLVDVIDQARESRDKLQEILERIESGAGEIQQVVHNGGIGATRRLLEDAVRAEQLMAVYDRQTTQILALARQSDLGRLI